VSLSGQVQLDPRLKSRVPADTVLFIFAKSVEQPGPPLAVFRTTAASWPVQFMLDDSMAMMPTRKLSDFQKVTVEARLSRSGSANPSAGDLRGASGVLNPRQASAPLRIIIDKEIG
jgi:cytochrome c-type biogenesis protein CcmH